MTSVVIDKTDVRVSRLSFGTASLHHLVSAGQRQRLLDGAAGSGITHFDTSPYYGDGLAESDLGRFRAHGVTIATKVGLYPRAGEARYQWQVWTRKVRGKLERGFSDPVVDWSIDRARNSLRESLRRLRRDYVDFLFLHEPQRPLIDGEAMLRWLESEKTAGTIRAWGVAGLASAVEPWVAEKSPIAAVVQTHDDSERQSADFLRTHGRPLQFTYGYLSSSVKSGRPVEDLMRAALRRNTHGSVLVSTRRPERVAALAACIS